MSFYKREDPDPEDWTPHHSEHRSYVCRGCKTILAHGDAFKFFNGWAWCLEPCYREVSELAMRNVEGQEQAARQDIERDDFMDTFNRSRR